MVLPKKKEKNPHTLRSAQNRPRPQAQSKYTSQVKVDELETTDFLERRHDTRDTSVQNIETCERNPLVSKRDWVCECLHVFLKDPVFTVRRG